MLRACVALTVVGGLLAAAQAQDGELRRRPMFGAQLAAVTKEVKERQKLDTDEGVVIEKVFAGLSAADAQFKEGDVILAVDGVKLPGTAAFLEKVAQARAGDVLMLDFVRDTVKGERRVTLKETPREKPDGYDVIYGFVTSGGVRLRTIVTRPKAEGRHPAVMFLQGGIGCFSVDNPVGPPFGFTWVAKNLAKRGYVTLRVERPGCGDSEGGPLRDVDFDTELEGNKQTLRALKEFDFVDPDKVFLFGHSMGGIMAPLMAVDLPVRGIAVYGSTADTWFEAVFGQRRRLAALDGTSPAEVDRVILDQARFWYPLLIERKTPREMREQNADLPQRVYDQWVKDDKYVFERHYSFYHQLAGRNLTAAWTKVASTRLSGGKDTHPRVLSIWGTTDWLAERSSCAWIAEVVNRAQPGAGSFVALDEIDHFFLRTATPQESYRYFKPEKGMPPTEFNTVILDTLSTWLNEALATKEKAS